MDSIQNTEMAEREEDDEFALPPSELQGEYITRSHYIPKTERTQCQNKECGLVFGYRRPHHCHRCGEIFCRPCLRYRRRLNVMAQPDPLGVPQKVCFACFDERIVNFGCTKRSHTELFLDFRHKAREEMRHIECDIKLQSRHGTIFWKEQFNVDILKECRRLLDGFKRTFGTLEAVMTLMDLQHYVIKIPDWQKSTFWSLESDMNTCRKCGGKLGRRKKIRNCRVCGISLCKKCSYKELLIYFENGTRPSKTARAKLAIIKVVGSPAKEPDVSMLLHCCRECREEIIQRQIEDEYWYNQKPKPPDLESEMVRMDDKFRDLTESINDNMEKLSSLIDEYDLTKEPDGNEENNNLDTSELKEEVETNKDDYSEEKIKLDTIKDTISRELDSYWCLHDELKTIFSSCDKPEGARLNVTYNYFKAKRDFYLETKSKFARLSNYEMPPNMDKPSASSSPDDKSL